MSTHEFIKRMPKVELHVHLEGSIRPETLLTLAERNRVSIPADSVNELRHWYRFSDFAHFIEVYFAICSCLRTPADFELITYDFLKNQAAQNIHYSEVIFTPYTHREHVSFDEQLAAINRARSRAEAQLGVRMGLVPDISRDMRPVEASDMVAEWAVQNMQNGIIALGIGGPEIDNPPELFTETFARARSAGLPSLPHAGETEGPQSIWGAIESLHAARIGHGIRCLEDPNLVAYLCEVQIPLDVSPTSNVCLGVAPSLREHPLPSLLENGLFVTINSDDPPMFNTSLTQEYERLQSTFGFDLNQIQALVLNGIRASLLAEPEKVKLKDEFELEFAGLRQEFGL